MPPIQGPSRPKPKPVEQAQRTTTQGSNTAASTQKAAPARQLTHRDRVTQAQATPQERARIQQATQTPDPVAARQDLHGDLHHRLRSQSTANNATAATQAVRASARNQVQGLDAAVQDANTAREAAQKAQEASARASQQVAQAQTRLQDAQAALGCVNPAVAGSSSPSPAQRAVETAQGALDRARTQERTAQQAALDAGNAALTAQHTANTKATLAGTAAPFPDANGVGSMADVQRLPSTTQARILGAPAAVNPQQVAQQALDQSRVAQQDAATARDRAQTTQAALDTASHRLEAVYTHGATPQARDAAARDYDAAKAANDQAQQQWSTARTAATTAGNRAITAQQDANSAAQARGETVPFPDAANVRDVADAGSLPRDAQARVLGAPSVVTPQEAARVDAQRVATATAQGPQQGAQELERQLRQNPDPAYRKALLEESAPSVTKIAADLDKLEGKDQNATFKATMESLSRSGELAGRDNVRTLTNAYAKGLPDGKVDIDDKDRLGGSLKQAIQDGNGALFATELAGSLQREGKADAARDVAKLTSEAVSDVTGDFKEKADKVDQLNGELARYVSEWSGVLSKEELDRGINAFKEKHKSEYSEFEAAAAKQASVLEGSAAALANKDALQQLDRRPFDLQGSSLAGAGAGALQQTPRVLESEAGSRAAADALQRAGRGENTFLDGTNAQALGLEGDEAKAFDARMQHGVMGAAAARGAALSQAGDLGGLRDLVGGMERHAGTLGLPAGSLQPLRDVIDEYAAKPVFDPVKFGKAFAANAREAAVLAAGPALRAATPGISDADLREQALKTNTGRAIGAFGLVVSGASIAQNLSSGEADKQIRAVADSLKLGDDVLSLLGKTGAAADFFKAAGKFAKPVGIFLDSLSVVDAARKGDYAQAGISAASIAGTIAAGAVGGPVGLAIGVGTVAFTLGAQAVLNHFRENKAEDRAEDNLGTFLNGALQGTGVSAEAVDRWRDVNRGDHASVGRILGPAAEQLGITPRELFERLSRLDKDTLKKVIDTAEEIPRGDDGAFRATDGTDGQVGTMRPGRFPVPIMPQSVTGWVNWLQQQGYV